MHLMRRTVFAVLPLAVVAVLLASCSGSGGPSDAAGDSSSSVRRRRPLRRPTHHRLRQRSATAVTSATATSPDTRTTPSRSSARRSTRPTRSTSTSFRPAVAFDGVEIQNDAVQAAAARKCKATFPGLHRRRRGDAGARPAHRHVLPAQTSGLRRRRALGALRYRRGRGTELAWPHCRRTLKGSSTRTTHSTSTASARKGDPGAAGATLVMCSEPHTYRAVAAFELGRKKAPYPGEAKTLAEGKQSARTSSPTCLV